MDNICMFVKATAMADTQFFGVFEVLNERAPSQRPTHHRGPQQREAENVSQKFFGQF